MAEYRRNKVKLTLSVDPATAQRFLLYAEQKHTTRSQALTDWIWAAEVAPPQEQKTKATAAL